MVRRGRTRKRVFARQLCGERVAAFFMQARAGGVERGKPLQQSMKKLPGRFLPYLFIKIVSGETFSRAVHGRVYIYAESAAKPGYNAENPLTANKFEQHGF